MGGSRCCFRQCPVASERNKGMHFFKFPIKDTERFKRWVKLAGVENFLNLTKAELWNKVICSRHFHETNFMNFTHKRLTMSATPTLHRLNEEYALDYSNDANNPVLIKLPAITSPHLIPPEGYPNTMHFIAADRKLADEIILSFEKNESPDVIAVFGSKRRQTLPLKIQESKKPKLIEKKSIVDECSIVLFEGTDNDLIENATISSSNEVLEIISACESKNLKPVNKNTSKECMSNNSVLLQYVNNEVFVVSDQQQHLDDDFVTEELYEEQLSKESKNSEATRNELIKSEEIISNLNKKLIELNAANEQLQIQLSLSEKKHKDLSEELVSMVSAYDTLQQEQKELEIKYADLKKQQQQNGISPSVPTTKQQQQGQPQQQQQLTKIQLFNGIKKYLSQTMVALLRIQLSSGSAEREWKPDEKRLAVDLMELGEQVYKYFTDEWLIRLPPLRQVRLWRNIIGAVDDEDDI